MDTEQVWFLDCFCYKAAGGRGFPVNTFYHEELEVVMRAAKDLLEREMSGIDQVTIARETLGQAPVRLEKMIGRVSK